MQLLLSTAVACAALALETPESQLLARFADHDVVLLGESPHQGRSIHAFLAQVLARPDFAERVDDVMVEFGNARHQGIVDRYLLELADVPRSELARAWRDTTQLLVWDSPVYEEFFATVRALNTSLARGDRVRVLLGDPPIDWAEVETASELEPWLDRESSYLAVLEREVLARDRKALVVIGSAHCMERTPSAGFAEEATERSWLGHLLHARHPGRSSTIYSFFGRAPLAGFEGVDGWSAPTWVDLATDPIGEASFGRIAPRLSVQREVDGRTVWVSLEAEDWPAMRVMVDALLYLGESEDGEAVLPLPETYADATYARELLRRARLLDELFGFESYVPRLRAVLPDEEE